MLFACRLPRLQTLHQHDWARASTDSSHAPLLATYAMALTWSWPGSRQRDTAYTASTTGAQALPSVLQYKVSGVLCLMSLFEACSAFCCICTRLTPLLTGAAACGTVPERMQSSFA